MRLPLRFAMAGLLLISLAACGLNSLISPPADQRQEALDTFTQAMRLGEFRVASSYLLPELRAPFLERFKNLDKDLTIVDTRVEEVTVLDNGEKVDVAFEMDYYLLPSVAVRTFRFDHTWVHYGADGGPKSGYLIETPFPSFP